jgi:transcriptional regulator of met regulon
MAYIAAKELRAVVPDQYRDAALSDQEGTTPDPGMLQAVIDAACNEVDALIEGRVNLPLSQPYPQKIKTAAVYIALSMLFTRRGIAMPEDTAKTVAWWRERLGKVGAGELRIEAPDAETDSATTLSTRGSIVVRPSITGTGGLIGAILLLLSVFGTTARAIDARTFEFTAPTNPMIESPDFMEWSQAESVGLRYILPAADGTSDVRWEVSDATNLWLNMDPVCSGSAWIWNPAPTQTCLASGRYQGRVAVYTRTGTNLTFHRILAWQDIRVHPARDPQNLVFASPLDTLSLPGDGAVQAELTAHKAATNPHSITPAMIGAATGQPLYAETDAAAIGALNQHKADTNPHAITPAMIGAATGQPLYAETDAAAIGALNQHKADTNPHAITPAMIGAATGQPIYAESDEAGLAAASTVQDNLNALSSSNVPVSCVGGYYYADYFTLSTTPYAYTSSSIGSTGTTANVMASLHAFTGVNGLILTPSIVRQSDWTDDVSYSDLIGLQIVLTNGYTVAEWISGSTNGTAGSLMATLGDFSASVSATYSTSDSWSNWYFVADAPGSLRALVNTSLLARADMTNLSQTIYQADAYATTNFIRNANCWVSGIDFTCASPWNSAGKNYYAGTLVTPRHILYAAHFVAPTGTAFRWIDSTNGIHDRVLLKNKGLHDDIALGLLSSELPAGIEPAKLMQPSDIGCFRGHADMPNDPGFRLVVFDLSERAYIANCRIDNAGSSFSVHEDIRQEPGVFGREKAIGGDSGNPIFLVVGTNTILFSTQSSANAGPGLANHFDEIVAGIAEMGGSTCTVNAAWRAYDGGTNGVLHWKNFDMPDL